MLFFYVRLNPDGHPASPMPGVYRQQADDWRQHRCSRAERIGSRKIGKAHSLPGGLFLSLSGEVRLEEAWLGWRVGPDLQVELFTEMEARSAGEDSLGLGWRSGCGSGHGPATNDDKHRLVVELETHPNDYGISGDHAPCRSWVHMPAHGAADHVRNILRLMQLRGVKPVVSGIGSMVNLAASGSWKPCETGGFRGMIVGFVMDAAMDIHGGLATPVYNSGPLP